MNSSRKHLEFLDHFRGFAVLAVLIFHTRLAAIAGIPDQMPWNGWFRDFSHASLPSIFLFPANFGRAGVPIFFVVSGFCIHLSFHQHGKKWKDFFIRRIFRIYPAYLAALMFFATGVYAGKFSFNILDGNFQFQFFTHLFLVHNFHLQTFFGFNGAFWSLAIEFQLYLLYPMLLVLSTMLGWRRIMITLAGFELTIHVFESIMQATAQADNPGFLVAKFLGQSVLNYWFSWALGACVADAFLKKIPIPFLKPSPAFWLAFAVAGYFFRPLDAFWFTLPSLATAAALSQLLSMTDPRIKMPAFCLFILKKFGLWSYSLYLLHYPLLEIYKRDIEWVVPDEYQTIPMNCIFALLTWLAIIPISILWYNLFEIPGIALSRQILEKTIRAGLDEPPVIGKTETNQSSVIIRNYCVLVVSFAVLIIFHLLKF